MDQHCESHCSERMSFCTLVTLIGLHWLKDEAGASPAGDQGGLCPPDFFLALPRYFFGRKKLVFLGEKNVKICDFGQKKPSHFGENLCPPDFNFAPPISRSWRRPCTGQSQTGQTLTSGRSAHFSLH